MSALKQEVICIEEEQKIKVEKENILLDHTHKLWPVYFWVVASVIGILLGMGVVNG